MIAAMYSSPERGSSSEKTVELLLSIGKADPNIQTVDGNTALMYAVHKRKSSERTVQMLLAYGASRIIEHKGGCTMMTFSPNL